MDYKNINWYPGHMKKAEDMIRSHIKLVDMVVEVADARIPMSSRNPAIEKMAGKKVLVTVLNKADLADSNKTDVWIETFRKQGKKALPLDSRRGKGLNDLKKLVKELVPSKRRPPRLLIAGIPNSGKSSLINRLVGKKSARVGNKAGVTKNKQWLNIPGSIQLLDTPGILMPKIESERSAFYLALCGSIKEGIADPADLALDLIDFMADEYPKQLMRRYSIDSLLDSPLENMELIAQKRGFIMSGKRIDYDRTARALIDDYRSGKLGRITLEMPKELGSEV